MIDTNDSINKTKERKKNNIVYIIMLNNNKIMLCINDINYC